MASSDDVTPSRKILKVGDVAYKRANSESIMNRFAGTNNFIGKYQHDTHRWVLNGSYSVATGIVLFDGMYNFFYNSEIVGVYFWNGQQGASGVTDFDIEWVNTSGGVEGSIFSARPTIDSTASDVALGVKNLVTF